MGNSNSGHPEVDADDCFDGIETLGYRVLGVQPNSPASAAGLVSFFDFLIGANGELLLGSGEELQEGEEYDDVDFPALLESFKGRTLQLLVHNIKSQQQRLVDIVPNDDWDGAGLLGVTIRLDNYAGAEDRLIRILSVEPQSPAAIAGLVENQDYLLGTTTHSFDSTQVLAMVLEAHIDRVVELYVYNTNSDKVRVVALMPTLSWGGNGLLGAEVGTGYLHRLPGSCRSTLGGSVERKVRWIGGKAPPPQQRKSQQQQSQQEQQPEGTLELEPQLEMEPHEDDGEDEQQRHKAPSEVAYERETSMGTVSLDQEHQEQNSNDNYNHRAPSQTQSQVKPTVETVAASEANVDEQVAAAASVESEASSTAGEIYNQQPPEPSSAPPAASTPTKTEPKDESNDQQQEQPDTPESPEAPAAPAPAPFALFRNPFASAPPPPPPPSSAAASPPVQQNGGGSPYNNNYSSPSSISTPPKPVSAQDLFAGPPPDANAATPDHQSASPAPAPFSTPHPPGSTPPAGAFGGLPPPPAMSGAR